MDNRLIVGIVLMSLLLNIALGQRVYVNFDHAADFAQFRTYAWGGAPNPNAMADLPLMQSTQRDIDSQLTTKGLKRIQEFQYPDLIVLASAGMKNKTVYNRGTCGCVWQGGMGEITPATFDTGALVVDIYDARRKQMVWQGIAKNMLSSAQSRNDLHKVIARMFNEYP